MMRSRLLTRRLALAIGVAVAALATACSTTTTPPAAVSTPDTLAGSSASPDPPGPSADPGPKGSKKVTYSPDPATACVSSVLSKMSLEQQVGQLFVMGVSSTAPTADELTLIGSRHLGGVALMGHTSAGSAATKRVADNVQARGNANGVPLWVSVDQEGGNVQVLRGPGFSAMPTALAQGGMSPTALRADAHTWGEQLHSSGVNLDLAPVLDTVPTDMSKTNKPIGNWDREYGHTPETVSSHGTAFAAGMTAAGVEPTVKHFPGLGRVRGNTDTTTGVTDNVTTRHDPYLVPFAHAVADGVPVVMMSLARYDKIDGKRAVFSPVIMRDMLRGDIGFHGVIMSDSMSAAAVNDLTAGQRATRFLAAGGTVVLDTHAADIGPMVDAVLAKANDDPGFASTVRADAWTVLAAKQRGGLLSCRGSGG